MKKLLTYLLVVLLSVIGIDLLNRAVYSYAFNHLPSNAKIADEYKFVMNHQPSDVLVIGASRAVHHYNPSLIENSLQLSCYNAGFDGTGIVHNYLSFLKALKNGSVECVILDLSPSQLQKEWNTDRLSQIFPYYWSMDSVKALVDEFLPVRQRIWLASSLVQYNSNLYDVLRTKITRSEAVKGFLPIPASKQLPASRFNLQVSEQEFIPFVQAENVLVRLVNVCREQQIRLVLCQSPTTAYNSSFARYLTAFAEKEEVEFWDYGKMQSVMEHRYFKDASHLNITGANLFTLEIIKRLRIHSACPTDCTDDTDADSI